MSTGPNGVPYKVHKNAPDVLRFLWGLMRTVWQRKRVPNIWHRTGGVLIPKEKEAENINQFRPISLLNVEDKIFFSVIVEGCQITSKEISKLTHLNRRQESQGSKRKVELMPLWISAL